MIMNKYESLIIYVGPLNFSTAIAPCRFSMTVQDSVWTAQELAA